MRHKTAENAIAHDILHDPSAIQRNYRRQVIVSAPPKYSPRYVTSSTAHRRRTQYHIWVAPRDENIARTIVRPIRRFCRNR